MNHAVLVGYLTREVEIEQLRGGHLAGRTLLAVPRGRQGRGPGADFVPVLVQGRVNVLAAAALRAGDRVWVAGRLAASYTDVRAGRFRVVARELVPLGGGPSDAGGAAGGRRGRGPAVPTAAESSTRVERAGRRHSSRRTRGAEDIGGPGSPQRTASARRPYLAVLPGGQDLDVRGPALVLDRDDGEAAA